MLPAVIDPPDVIRSALRARTDEPTTQTQLASHVGLSWRQWQARMSGEVDWRLDELRRVARVLDIPLSDLTGEDES
jgi:predicted transcriptional regulator